MNDKYVVFNSEIPSDNYEVISLIQNMDGTEIRLEGERYTLTVKFGSIQCLCVCDEGVRIESYNKIEGIQTYRKNGFYGAPLYRVYNSRFSQWLKYESCVFSENQNHYAIITINDLIDIAAPFPPKVEISKKFGATESHSESS